MDDLVANKVSFSMRNAINVNSQRNHLLGKTVKHLEAERDLRLLNLQIKKDEVVFGSSSSRGRGLATSPTASDILRSRTPVSQQEIYNLTASSNKDDESARLQKASNLPPLQLDQASLIATPPRTRRATTIRMASSPNSAPQSPLESYIPSHKCITSQFSSSLVPAGTNSMENARELRRENSDECKQQFSPGLLGSSTHTPVAASSSSGVFKFDLTNSQVYAPQRPRTASSSKHAAESEVHRGLSLRPVSSSKEQTKAREVKKESVFNRLYSSGKKHDGKVSRETTFPMGNPKVEAGRRRSISLPDLSEILDKLKTCRYLRDNSQRGEKTTP